MNSISWWQKPVLRMDEEHHQERKTGWLELFLDLVFMAIVAQLSRALSQNVSGNGILSFFVLFVPAWWMWVGTTVYHDRFETDGASHRVLIFLQMLPIAALALFAQEGMGRTALGFAGAYISARVLLIFLWLRGGYYNPAASPLTRSYAIGFGLSVVLWSISLLAEPPLRFYLWGAGLMFDIITPLFTMKIQARLPKMSTSHLPERYGLFTLIVLGECVIGVIQSAAARARLNWTGGITVFWGLALAFGFWWLYFNFVYKEKLIPQPWRIVSWSSAHLPLLTGLTAVGAAVQAIIAANGGGLVSEPNCRLLCGAVGATLLSLLLISFTLHNTPAQLRRAPALIPGGAGLIALLLMALGLSWNGASLLLWLALLVWGAILACHLAEKNMDQKNHAS